MSTRSGVAVSALHYYEREGLIRAVRTSGNQRRYTRDQLRRVAFIRMSQRVGIPLARIRDALNTLPTDHTPSTDAWRQLSAQWRTELDARIAILHELRNDLDGCIGCGCLSVKHCSLVNPDDARAAEGPGPRSVVDAIDAAARRDVSLNAGLPTGATRGPARPTLDP